MFYCHSSQVLRHGGVVLTFEWKMYLNPNGKLYVITLVANQLMIDVLYKQWVMYAIEYKYTYISF